MKQILAAPSIFPSELAGLQLDVSEGRYRYTKDDLWEYMNGGAHEVVRLGFEQLIVAVYREAGTDREVLAEIYTMKTPGAAGTLFDDWRSKKMKSGNICGRSLSEGPLFSWQKDAIYVRLIANFDVDSVQTLLERVGRGLCAVFTHD